MDCQHFIALKRKNAKEFKEHNQFNKLLEKSGKIK